MLSAVTGALFAFLVTALSFILTALLDGARSGEAIGFGLAAGVAGAWLGGLIGLVVGALGLGLLGGALAGMAATVAAVAFYVLAFGEPGRFAYFLRESAVIWLVLGLPAVLTGVVMAILNRRLRRESQQ